MNLHRNYLHVAIVCAFTMALCGCVYFLMPASSAASDDFKVGDKVEATVSGLTEVESSYEPCVVTEILNTGYRLMCGKMEFVVQKAWVRRAKAAAEKPKADDKMPEPTVQNPNGGDDEPVVKDKNDAPCNFDPPGPKLTNNERFSSTVAKREIYDNYWAGWNKNGTTAPLNIGVTFLSLEMGRSYVNRAENGWRINDAAPLNATIYHVKSKHIICEQYRNRTLRRQVESGYACFKNRDAEWACGIDGVPKITQLD